MITNKDIDDIVNRKDKNKVHEVIIEMINDGMSYDQIIKVLNKVNDEQMKSSKDRKKKSSKSKPKRKPVKCSCKKK